jgi:hypothetical protein
MIVLTRKEQIAAVKDQLVKAITIDIKRMSHLSVEEAQRQVREASRAAAAKLFDALDRRSPTYLIDAGIIVEAIVALAQELPALMAQRADS